MRAVSAQTFWLKLIAGDSLPDLIPRSSIFPPVPGGSKFQIICRFDLSGIQIQFQPETGRIGDGNIAVFEHIIFCDQRIARQWVLLAAVPVAVDAPDVELRIKADA